MKCDGVQGFPRYSRAEDAFKTCVSFLFHPRRIRKDRLLPEVSSMIALIASYLLASVLVPSAHAETPPAAVVNVTVVAPVVTDEASDATEVPTSQYGVSLVIGSNCTVKVTGKNMSPVKAAAVVSEIESAKALCLAAKAKRDDKARADQVATARSASLDKLIVSAGKAGEEGTDVRVVTDDVTVEIGDHLDWQAFGGSAMNGNGYVPGMPVGYVDPSAAAIFRLNYFGSSAHPAVPGAVMPLQQPVVQTPPSTQPVASADTVALGACRTALEKKGKMLETCAAGR